jgi:colanic acid/amylovoran biosynthesis glycosyltransferase
MPTVAYLANLFPSSVEPYVGDEIEELRRRGVRVIAGSVRRPNSKSANQGPEIILQAISARVLLHGLWLCIRKWPCISDVIWRIIFRGPEGPVRRIKALVHTWLGGCLAVLLEKRGVDHIHVHHGYFGSWIAMVAARLLNVSYSLTLHGSDLLLHGAYLDAKLKACSFCLTISEFNRCYILEHYPTVTPDKVLVSRLGVDVPVPQVTECPQTPDTDRLKLLAVGRLHPVKNHNFLIRACVELAKRGIDFECAVAGDGPEGPKLANLIRTCGLMHRVELLGHVPRERIDALYQRADVVVLTSHSEGVPLALMEAMACGKIVLAPKITGIPELVLPGRTGFLYQPGSLADFVDRVLLVRSLLQVKPGVDPRHLVSAARQLDWMRHAAQVHVHHNFDRSKNLKSFADLFLTRIVPANETLPHANFILQQI